MYKCPWCGEKTFTFWQKQTLGPTRTLQCSACTRRASVDMFRAQVAAVPVLLLGFLGLLLGKALFGTWPAVLLGGWLGVTLGMCLTAPLYHLYVPLVRPGS